MPSTTLSSTGVVFPDATTQETALRKDTANTFTALQTFSSSISVTGTVSATGDISSSSGSVSDSKGDVRRIISKSGLGGGNLDATDAGKTIILDGTWIGILGNTYQAGDVITFINYGVAVSYLVLYMAEAYISGTNVNRGNGGTIYVRVRGVVTIIFANPNMCFVSGAVY